MNELERLNEFTRRYISLCDEFKFHFSPGWDRGAIVEGDGVLAAQELESVNAYIKGRLLEFDGNKWEYDTDE